jgi:hypothetical protein
MTRSVVGSRAFALLVSVIDICHKRQVSPWPYLGEVIARGRGLRGQKVPLLPAPVSGGVNGVRQAKLGAFCRVQALAGRAQRKRTVDHIPTAIQISDIRKWSGVAAPHLSLRQIVAHIMTNFVLTNSAEEPNLFGSDIVRRAKEKVGSVGRIIILSRKDV